VRIGLAITACVALCIPATDAALAQSWPAKPIRLISPFPPGGGIDASARIVSQALTQQLGQQVIVENRGGAAGRIGTEVAAKAAADGYTLLLGSIAPNAIIPSSGVKLPYDAIRDFAPISLVGATDYTLVVHPSLPARSVAEVLQLSKRKPGELTFGSSGNLTASHLSGELLNQLAKVRTTHVAYKGTGIAAVAVLSGEIAMLFGSGPSVAPHVHAKRLRPLATTGTKRSNPKLPLMSETLPGFEVTQWYGVLAPAGTPLSIVTSLNAEIARAIETPRVVQQFASIGAEAVASTPANFAALIKADIARWGTVLRAANIVVD
jgi:tripartite-type tricarboxylate transporter receptor subunit TctC